MNRNIIKYKYLLCRPQRGFHPQDGIEAYGGAAWGTSPVPITEENPLGNHLPRSPQTLGKESHESSLLPSPIPTPSFDILLSGFYVSPSISPINISFCLGFGLWPAVFEKESCHVSQTVLRFRYSCLGLPSAVCCEAKSSFIFPGPFPPRAIRPSIPVSCGQESVHPRAPSSTTIYAHLKIPLKKKNSPNPGQGPAASPGNRVLCLESGIQRPRPALSACCSLCVLFVLKLHFIGVGDLAQW